MENVLCIIWVLFQRHRLLKRLSLLDLDTKKKKKETDALDTSKILYLNIKHFNKPLYKKDLNKSYPRLFNLLECEFEQVRELVYCQHCHCFALCFNAFSNCYFLQQELQVQYLITLMNITKLAQHHAKKNEH